MAPSREPFTLLFDTQDAGVPHNIDIQDHAGASVFKGEIVFGPIRTRYQVRALAPGSYSFVCDVHPIMAGTLVVPGAIDAPSPSASPAPTELALPTAASPSDTPDKELEALLPIAYKGVTFTKASRANTRFSSSDSQRSDFDAILRSLGKTTADVSIALAFDPAFKDGVIFGVYRIKGVEASVWAPLYWAFVVKQTPGTTVSDVRLGGKPVTEIVTPQIIPKFFAWPEGDVLFIVITKTEAQARDAIPAFPWHLTAGASPTWAPLDSGGDRTWGRAVRPR